MARDSVILETDTVDTSSAEAPWWDLAQQLKQDLASIILMSEADLQVQYQDQSSISLTVFDDIPIPACTGEKIIRISLSFKTTFHTC